MRECRFRHLMVSQFCRYAGLLLAILVCSTVAMAAEYPIRPIKVIVPYGAGGGTDVMVRAVAQYIGIGQPMVVINIAGASSGIGTMEAYNSKPDGYTLLAHMPEALLPYSISGTFPVSTVWKELEPVAAVVRDYSILTTRKDAPFKSLNDVLAYAKANPAKLKWGSTGVGGSNHVDFVQIFDILGLEVNYVPYDSASKSRPALLGGHIDVLYSQISEIYSSIEAGEVVPLAVTARERSKFLPEVPTFSEFGVDIESAQHRGFFAPPKTPEPIIMKLQDAMKAVTSKEDFRSLVEDKLRYERYFMSSDDIRKYMNDRAPVVEALIKKIL